MDEQYIFNPASNQTIICPSNGYTFQRGPDQVGCGGMLQAFTHRVSLSEQATAGIVAEVLCAHHDTR